MKRIIFFLFIATIGIVSCKDKKTTTEKDAVTEQKTETVMAPGLTKDSTAIRTVIMNFYNWYNTNFAKFQEYDLYSGIKKKDMPPYKINWDQVTKYQDFIRTSAPQLGEEFLSNQKKFFQQCDSAFKTDTQDELPYGFDYDWYTNTQEDPQYTLDEMNKAKQWIINVNGDNATTEVKGTFDDNGKQTEMTVIKLALKKESGQWKIAKIGTE
ncbi:MAG: hypothetical protein LH619_03165 [Chitinophagaceae bacterium]|nr:hypothetical protein [Chitinophagaceae bacterium]